MADQPTKIHLGCGYKKLPGWINVDSVKEFQPDLLHDITERLPWEDLSVNEILAEDILEHFDKYARFLVFYEWARVLKIGGSMTLQVPNFKKILFRYFKFGFPKVVDLAFGENMWNGGTYLGHFGNHKWGYSEDTLKEFVGIFGIEAVELKSRGLNLRLVGKKVRHVSWEEINQVKIYAYANDYEQGQPQITVADARRKIMDFHKRQNPK